MGEAGSRGSVGGSEKTGMGEEGRFVRAVQLCNG
jgi:hypothetical protein